MTTAADVIKGAMKDLGILERTEDPQGQESLDMLDLLNQMCHSWIYDGIDLEWITIGLNETLAYPEDQIGPIRYNLAMMAAPMFEIVPNPVLVSMASQGKKRLQRAYLDIDEMDTDEFLKPIWNPNTQFTSGNFP